MHTAISPFFLFLSRSQLALLVGAHRGKGTVLMADLDVEDGGILAAEEVSAHLKEGWLHGPNFEGSVLGCINGKIPAV